MKIGIPKLFTFSLPWLSVNTLLVFLATIYTNCIDDSLDTEKLSFFRKKVSHWCKLKQDVTFDIKVLTNLWKLIQGNGTNKIPNSKITLIFYPRLEQYQKVSLFTKFSLALNKQHYLGISPDFLNNFCNFSCTCQKEVREKDICRAITYKKCPFLPIIHMRLPFLNYSTTSILSIRLAEAFWVLK